MIYKEHDSYSSSSSIKAKAALTAANGDITWGSAVTLFPSYFQQGYSAAYDPDTERIGAIAYYHSNGSDKSIRFKSMTLGGTNDTEISVDYHDGDSSFGVALDSGRPGSPAYRCHKLLYDTNVNKFIAIYMYDQNYNNHGSAACKSCVGSYNSSTGNYTWGSTQNIHSNWNETQHWVAGAFDSTTNRIVLCAAVQSPGKTRVIEGTISSSNNTCSWSNDTEITGISSNNRMTMQFDPGSGYSVIFHNHWASNNTYNAALITVKTNASSSPTFGSWAYVSYNMANNYGGDYRQWGAMAYDSGIQKLVVTYQFGQPSTGGNKIMGRILTIDTSGGISLSTGVDLSTQGSGFSTWNGIEDMVRQIDYHEDKKMTMTLASNNNNDNLYYDHFKTQGVETNLDDANDYVGFADAAYTNGQTATIKTYGNNVNTLSGLTIGSTYYVQGDGTVGTSQDTGYFSSLLLILL